MQGIENTICFGEEDILTGAKISRVRRVSCKLALLTDVNYENAYEKIFGAFKFLKGKSLPDACASGNGMVYYPHLGDAPASVEC